jgi:hypothetical protein
MASRAASGMADPLDPRQRRQIRLSLSILTAIVAALYFGFILYAVVRAHH